MKILILRFLLIKIELELRDAGMDGVADEGIIITALYMGLGRLIFKFYNAGVEFAAWMFSLARKKASATFGHSMS